MLQQIIPFILVGIVGYVVVGHAPIAEWLRYTLLLLTIMVMVWYALRMVAVILGYKIT